MAILNFFADAWSTLKAVEMKWFLFFNINFFYPLKLILKFFGGHFEFFGGHFEFFFADSWSTHKVVETKWSSFFHKLV